MLRSRSHGLEGNGFSRSWAVGLALSFEIWFGLGICSGGGIPNPKVIHVRDLPLPSQS